MSTYNYIPLQSPSHIRLIHLKIGDPGSPVVASTRQVSLDDEPEYVALSYTWDLDDNLSHEETSFMITCDGQTMQVQPNLFAAMQNLRSDITAATPGFWIDAVCINQRDNTERSQQVQIMQYIYAQARNVIVWLGECLPADFGLPEAFSKLHQFVENMDDNERLVRNFKGISLSEDEWRMIRSLFGTRWFTRVWIIQEVVMAHKIEVHYGHIRIEWEKICVVSVTLATTGHVDLSYLKEAGPGFHMVYTINKLKQHYTDGVSETVDNIMFDARAFGAGDPRDRFYALLGLIKDKNYPVFMPDYNKGEEQLYAECATYSLVEEHSFRSLAHAEKTSSGKRRTSSWVPDWCDYDNFLNAICYMQHFEVLKKLAPVVSVSEDLKALTLRGIQLDRVETLGTPRLYNIDKKPRFAESFEEGIQFAHSSRTQILDFLTECQTLAAAAFSPDEAPLESVWRTVICNSMANRSPPPSKLQFSFECYCELLKVYTTYDFSTTPQEKQAESQFLTRLRLLNHNCSYFRNALLNWSTGRVFGVTADKCLGMFPNKTHEGDIICAIAGANTPFVIRPEQDGLYSLVGGCYVHGLMGDEASKIPDLHERMEDITMI